MKEPREVTSRRYREKNRDKCKEATKRWRELHPEYNKIQSEEYKQNNPARRLLYSTKARAKDKGLEFSLVLEDIVIPEVCPYLGVTITNILKKGKVETNPSIDRIDPSMGYTKDNIQVISELANRMKNSATKEQLLTFAKNILKLNANRSNN